MDPLAAPISRVTRRSFSLSSHLATCLHSQECRSQRLASPLICPLLPAVVRQYLAIGALARGGDEPSPTGLSLRGCFVLAAEAIFAGLISGGLHLAAEMIRWQQWRLIDLSLVPGIWLLFSPEVCSRGRSASPVSEAMAAALSRGLSCSLAGVSFLFVKNLVSAIILNKANSHWGNPIGMVGHNIVLYISLMISSVLVLTNLEQYLPSSRQEHYFSGSSSCSLRWSLLWVCTVVGLFFCPWSGSVRRESRILTRCS